MKRFISVFISMLVFISIFTAITTYAEVKTHRKDGYVYTYKNDGVQILHYFGKASNVTVPSEIDGKKVVKLGVDYNDEYKDEIDALDEAGFSGNKYVKTVTVPSGIKSFGSGVFSECKNLKKVVFKNGISQITRSMFSGCVSLETISIPETVTNIGAEAFAECKKLKEVKIPSSVTSIEDGAFFKSGLTKFHISKNLKNISWNVNLGETFYGTNLKKITVSKSNKKYSVKSGVLYNKKKSVLIYYPYKKSSKTFTIPNTVEKISRGAFWGNRYLKKVVISKDVITISDNSFRGCRKLAKVTFMNKKRLKIKYSAFLDCKALKNVNIPQKIVKLEKQSLGYYITNSTDFKVGKIKGFTIKGYKGTAAEKYAKVCGFKFVAVQ